MVIAYKHNERLRWLNKRVADFYEISIKVPNDIPEPSLFLKYLPVEGKINKNGQEYLSFLDSYTNLQIFESDVDYGTFKPSNKNGDKPAKLFLCSLDVKPGDIARLSFRPDEEFVFNKLEAHSCFDVFNKLEDYVFKVIQEVQPITEHLNK